MPKYNFFKVKKDDPKPVTQFSEFRLHSTPTKQKKILGDLNPEFKARKMPDFQRMSIKMSLTPTLSARKLTIQKPFSLNTDARGADKQLKFGEQIQE